MNQKDKLDKLQAKWYARLKKEGFRDIETPLGQLKLGSDMYHQILRNGTAEQKKTHYESKERYYQLAGQFLHDHEFQTPKEKLIWELHSEGMSHAQIRTLLKKKKMKVISTGTIKSILQPLTKLMLSQTDKYEQE